MKKLSKEEELEREFIKEIFDKALKLGAGIRKRNIEDRNEVRYLIDFPCGGLINVHIDYWTDRLLEINVNTQSNRKGNNK